MYWKLFVIFAKIGAFTIGGGVAMIPLIEREVVHKNKWIAPEDFLDIISIAQSAPGLIAVNVSIFVGHRLAGIKGSIVATSLYNNTAGRRSLHHLPERPHRPGRFQGYPPGSGRPDCRPGLPHGRPEPAQLDYRRHRSSDYGPHRISENLPHLDYHHRHRRRPHPGLQPAGQA